MSTSSREKSARELIEQLCHQFGEDALGLSGFEGDDVAIGGLTSDSRKVKPGDVFFALPSASSPERSGESFVLAAVEAGASLIVSSAAAEVVEAPHIVVPDVRRACSLTASWFFDSPDKELLMLGVTGTNGKTTVASVIHQMLVLLGESSLRIGTLGADCRLSGSSEVSSWELENTTPPSESLMRILAESSAMGATAAVMECSSHALELSRLDALSFDSVIFTNLSNDHLDFHGDMRAYFRAKKRLFEIFEQNGEAKGRPVVWVDDVFGEELAETLKSPIRVGTGETADLRLCDFTGDLGGLTLQFDWEGSRCEAKTQLIGAFNAENISLAIASLLSLGFDLADLLEVLPRVTPVPGRLEWIRGARGVTGVVDYSHTPAALESCLRVLRPLTPGKLWVAYGCGGDRDRSKRPMMLKAARENADVVILTNDNPRTEDPQQIVNDSLTDGLVPDRTMLDRREAICHALGNASKGDVVLVAGKGHEDYQILGTEKIHFSDIEEIRRFFDAQN